MLLLRSFPRDRSREKKRKGEKRKEKEKKKDAFDEEGPTREPRRDWLLPEALWFGFSAAVRRQGRLESGRINMPGSWDVTPHNNNKNLSVPFPTAAGPMRPSRSLGSRRSHVITSTGSVFTNHSAALRGESAPSVPSFPSAAPLRQIFLSQASTLPPLLLFRSVSHCSFRYSSFFFFVFFFFFFFFSSSSSSF